jgi:helicase SWR1
VNYKLSRTKPRQSIGTTESKDHNHRIIVKDGVKYIEDSENLSKHNEQKLTATDLLGKISAQHSLLTSELFHLKEYTSLVTWNPEATPSNFYNDFIAENYNMWEPKSLPNGKTRQKRHSLRHVSTEQDSLRSSVEDAEKKFIDEVFNPSKFYHDHFLLKAPSGSKKPGLSSSPVSSKIQIPQFKSRGRSTRIKPEDDEEKAQLNNTPRSSRGKAKATTTSEDFKEEESEDDSDVEQLPTKVFFKGGSIPKIKFKFSASTPGRVITHPDHLSKPAFHSIEDYLNSYKSLDEDVTNEEYENFIQEQRDVILKLRHAIEERFLTIDEKLNISKVPPPQQFRDPLKTHHTFNDHFVAQAVHLSKLFQDSRKAKVQRQRKIAQMIEVHFKRQVGAAERRRKEEEKKLRSLARNAMQAVKKRWMLAEKAYKILKNQEAEELKRIKGKEHLSQMLEHSTQLLEAQLTKQDESGDDSDAEVLDEAKEAELLKAREEIIHQLDDDSNLSIDELRLKYAHLRDLKLEEISEDNQADEETPEVETEVETIPELNEEEKKAIAAENNAEHDSLLDSDSSLDSDDDSDLSSEEEDDEGNTEPSGLAAFFGNGPTKIEDEDDDEDDESVKSYLSDEEIGEIEDTVKDEKDTTPGSTPDVNENGHQLSIAKDSRASTAESNDGVVDVPYPSLLLKGDLRSYQKQGLNWLASLYNNGTNGILADEMGLGKTIQTISLISYLAVNKGNWGPHLIVVPTSVILNWEMEFKRFAPGFKVMVYYGSPQERKQKRKGWNKPDTFHVCITSYQLVCQDQQIFKRKRWKYMILDEAHNIKNFKSNRWNALLNFNTENRLLLTGTPLQNNIMELWSLLYFLMPSSSKNQSMPSGFANLEDFQTWFGKPVDKIIEGGLDQKVDEETKQTVSKLHQVLRPYLLRRLKADVESQMPGKYEHVVYCKLSKRQYKLYHEYLDRSDTRNMLQNANYISIINALMQLRKVCNHPDLFEERQIRTSFAIDESLITPYQETNSLVLRRLKDNDAIDLNVLNLAFTRFENDGLTTYHSNSITNLKSSKILDERVEELSADLVEEIDSNYSDIESFYKYSRYHSKREFLSKIKQIIYINNLRCDKSPMYGKNLINELSVVKPIELDFQFKGELIKPLETRMLSMSNEIERFAFVTPEVVNLNMTELTIPSKVADKVSELENPLHKVQTKLSIQFPDKSLLLYDCGKLQKLAKLLTDLQKGGHRALIFTQMTKVLDILEQFLNIMGIRYMRLDGATKIEDRQILTERFNKDPKIMVFILSSRSGGLGINLTGADTVVFYDSDWNPAMDKQCQDRCHRIGQTRDVHIYRFVTEYTIESNILKKANQKRHLDDIVIQEGEFTTDYFSKLSYRDLLGNGTGGNEDEGDRPLFGDPTKLTSVLAEAEDEADAKAAKEAMKEVELDNEDFVENEDEEVAEMDADDREGFGHVDEYMIRFLANGYYYD